MPKWVGQFIIPSITIWICFKYLCIKQNPNCIVLNRKEKICFKCVYVEGYTKLFIFLINMANYFRYVLRKNIWTSNDKHIFDYDHFF